MGHGEVVPEAANWLASIAIFLGTAIAAGIAYLRKPRDRAGKEEVAVVSATFSDRATIERLTGAIHALEETIAANNKLLTADAQRRHDERLVREALREHGILK